MTRQKKEQEVSFNVIKELDMPVPMRDGVVLRANILRPDTGGPYPALLHRTPYGKRDRSWIRLVRAGYVLVSQDTRGRYASDGDYVPFCVDRGHDAEDGYDTVRWLAAQPYCDGNVGTFGGSYDAWMQWQLAKLRPPELKAMCAYTIPVELTEVDFPGAFKPGRRVHWWFNSMAPDLRRRHGWPPPHTGEEAKAIWNEVEHARWLGFTPWQDLPKHLPPGLAKPAAEWLANPTARVWKFDEAHQEVDVPNLDFTGWFDHCNGTIGHFTGMQRNGRTAVAREQTRILMGPWNHGFFGRELGGFDFGADAEVDTTDLMIRWFDHWLKGRDTGITDTPRARYFVMGTNIWRQAETWPPPHDMQPWQLGSNGEANRTDGGGLLAETSCGDTDAEALTVDPQAPTPTLWNANLVAGASDRQRLDYRRDILRYRSEPLAEPIEIAGYPELLLYAASDAPDADFFAHLVDEAPDGTALEICFGMVRARYRNGLEQETLLKPGEVTEFRIVLGATACCFQAGHRIRLEICGANFPNFDRNHHTGGNDLANSDMVTATHSICHSAVHPSQLLLPVTKRVD